MSSHGARSNALTPSLMPVPVPLHVTSSRKVHRSADGIINIIQEISFYADGHSKSLAGKLLNEVNSQPAAQVRGRFSAETNARVFVGDRIIRMHIQTSIRPNSSDSLELDEVFHFAEQQDALVVPITFEPTLERAEGPAVEFDLSSSLIVTLKQRILKDAGEQYKVLQAIELRANEVEGRPTQELMRKSTLTQPSNDTAQFRERIFAGTDVLRVDRDILFVCDRQVLSLSERREYMPEHPAAPRRRSASATHSATRSVRHTPDKPRSRSHSRSWTEDSENYHTANEDLPTAISPYSLREDASNSRIPPCSSNPRTARDVSPISSCPDSDRTSRSKRKKWTVNSVVSKAGAATPERYDRARTMRGLSTDRNLSLSPYNGNSEASSYDLPTARSSFNGEIPAVQAIPIVPVAELGPHGECTLVGGMDAVPKVAGPADSLVRTCADGHSPTRTRSESGCSTANQIPTCFSSRSHSRPSTPLRTALVRSPNQPSAATLEKRRWLFEQGPRPATSPSRSVRRSPDSAETTGREASSPSHIGRRIVAKSPVQTAVGVGRSSHSKSQHSRKSQKESHKKSKHSGKRAKPRVPIDYPASASSSTNLSTARNLFGTVSSSNSVARMFPARSRTPNTPRTAREPSRRSPALATARARSMTVSAQGCPNVPLDLPRAEPLDRELRIENWSKAQYDSQENSFGNHGPTVPVSPYRTLRTERSEQSVRTAADCSPARGLRTARHASPMAARVCPNGAPDWPTAEPLDQPVRIDNWSEQQYDANANNFGQHGPSLYRTSPYRTNRTERSEQSVHTAAECSPARGLRTARHASPMAARVCPNGVPDWPTVEPLDQPLRIENWLEQQYDANANNFGMHGPSLFRTSPYRTNRTERSEQSVRTASDCSPARGLRTGLQASPMAARVSRPRLLFGDVLTTPPSDLRTGRPLARSPYVRAQEPVEKTDEPRTGRAHSYHDGTLTARSPAQSLKTGRGQSPYDTTTARSPAPSVNTARQQSPYERTARSPADGIRTARPTHSPGPRSLYLAPQMAQDNAAPPAGDAAYTHHVATARAVTPDRSQGRMTASPHRSARTARGPSSAYSPATSRTQSPATRSDASNLATAQGARSPHVDTGSPSRLATARSRSRGVASPANLKTAREVRSSASRSPSARRTPEHYTMPDSALRQEDSYSEQSQFTFQKTARGFTQKATHSSDQRTPSKTDSNNPTAYYSARQTTPTRSLRPNDVTLLTQRTPKRDYSQHAGLGERSPVRTAVPKCSLKSGCQATHTPRVIPAGPDSDGQDSPTSRRDVIKTPEKSTRTARGNSTTRTPSAPFGDMRTPRTARGTGGASRASSLHRSPAPSSQVRTAMSPDAASNSNYSREEMNTARNGAAATEGPSSNDDAIAATAKPQVVVRASQADGKIHVEVCLSFKLNTTGTIRLRGEMPPALQPRSVSMNGQQIWSNRQ